MNEQNPEIEEALPENIEVATPGQLLREAREAAHLSVEDISKKLHLKVALISAIEENNFDEITSITFARGYLKSYAKLLHVDEEDIIAAFEHFTTAEQQQLEMQTFSNRKGKKTLDSWLTILTVLLVIGIIGAVAVWYMRNQPMANDTPSTSAQSSIVSENVVNGNETSSLDSPNQAVGIDGTKPNSDNLSPAGELLEPEPTTASVSEVAVEPATDIPAQTNDQTVAVAPISGQDTPVTKIPSIVQSTQDNNIESRADTKEQDSVPDDVQALSEPKQSAQEQNALVQNGQEENTPQQSQAVITAHLELRFEDSCWINIEDATGERIAIGTKVKGHYTSVKGVPPFTIKLGKPDAVSIWLDGQSRDIPYYPKGSIANFELAAN